MVDRVGSGDDQAFDGLLTRYQRPIRNFVYRMLGDADEADDVAQEVFVRAYRAMRDRAVHQGAAAFSTWLFQIARHAALDSLRKRRRHPADSLEALEDQGDTLAGPDRTARDHAANHDTGTEIANALAQLPEEQRAAIVLAEYEQRSGTEIAAILKCSLKSVESRLYRARHFLRQRLGHLLGQG